MGEVKIKDSYSELQEQFIEELRGMIKKYYGKLALDTSYPDDIKTEFLVDGFSTLLNEEKHPARIQFYESK